VAVLVSRYGWRVQQASEVCLMLGCGRLQHVHVGDVVCRPDSSCSAAPCCCMRYVSRALDPVLETCDARVTRMCC
jgi:hypothetical protein